MSKFSYSRTNWGIRSVFTASLVAACVISDASYAIGFAITPVPRAGGAISVAPRPSGLPALRPGGVGAPREAAPGGSFTLIPQVPRLGALTPAEKASILKQYDGSSFVSKLTSAGSEYANNSGTGSKSAITGNHDTAGGSRPAANSGRYTAASSTQKIIGAMTPVGKDAQKAAAEVMSDMVVRYGVLDAEGKGASDYLSDIVVKARMAIAGKGEMPPQLAGLSPQDQLAFVEQLEASILQTLKVDFPGGKGASKALVDLKKMFFPEKVEGKPGAEQNPEKLAASVEGFHNMLAQINKTGEMTPANATKVLEWIADTAKFGMIEKDGKMIVDAAKRKEESRRFCRECANAFLAAACPI
jgi:hypothetical protein